MTDAFFVIFDLLTAFAKLMRPGGARSTVAGNLLLKQQLIIHSTTATIQGARRLRALAEPGARLPRQARR